MWRKLLAGPMLATALVLMMGCSDEVDEPAAAATPANQAAAPAPTTAPTSAPIAPAQPAPAVIATATEAPLPTLTPRAVDPSANVRPSGTLTLAVADIATPNGLPRFCRAGCSENIYLAGITDTLFNSNVTPEGTIVTEPMLALSFELDSRMEFSEFTLRQGVQFHRGYGEMTAEDVAFSYNDANAGTNPDSIHGQAGELALLISSVDAVGKYKIRVNYRNYDSRGILHGFSRFWQTAGIVSKKVYDDLGADGAQNTLVGVGAFENDEWERGGALVGHAFTDYWGISEGWGPFVENIRWLEVPDANSRRAMLETGEVQIADVGLNALPELINQGFAAQKRARYNVTDSIAMSGNYWEKFGALTGTELNRERDISKAWVGDPFEGGGDFESNTPSMQRSKLVRNALAWSIERQTLVESLLGGLGFVNHQPYNSNRSPAHDGAWDWGTDHGLAKSLIDEAGYTDGFEMDLWVGTDELVSNIGESVAAVWNEQLGVAVNMFKTSYSAFRSGLASRSTDTPFFGCSDENQSNFPFDWAHGFVMSSIGASGDGVGMEIPWASETYANMTGESRTEAREALAATFFANNRDWALCIGVFERPLWPAFDPDAFVDGDWDMRPMANRNLAALNNLRTARLK